ncbi:MAG: hypothetical protein ACNS60_19400 [Candidatus Cyclobacteriaceae bacterium M2_1C_046]
MRYYLLLPVLLLISCEDSASDYTGCGCEDGYVVRELKGVTGTIEENFNSYAIFTEKHQALVSCGGLPDSLEMSGIKVKFSGNILNPCPNARYSGTLLEITKIEKL